MADDLANGHRGSPVNLEPRGVSPRLPALLAAIAFFALALPQVFGREQLCDFFIYRFGSQLAARGENPYDIAKVRAAVAAQFATENPGILENNCGFFLPPMATLVFLPFAVLPWAAAKVAWAVANGVAAYYIAQLPGLFRPPDSAPYGLGLCAAAVILVVNPLTLVIGFPIGQTAILTVGCMAAGLLAFDRGKPYLGAALWTLAFIKPHLALPLIPLAWFLGGWRPAALLILLVGSLNAAGATIAGGSPLFLRDYIEFLPNAREVVAFNRVELNAAISSWNRLMFAAGGPLIELTAATTVAGFLVWFGLLGVRVTLAGRSPSPTWAVAASGVGAILCSQVLAYELILLALTVPRARDLFASGYRVRGWLAVALLAAQLIPVHVMAGFGIAAHRPLAVALFAVLVLTGPIRTAPTYLPEKANG